MNITGGKYNGRKIFAPSEKITRPTLSKVRMSVFNTLFSMMNSFENKSFLDLFGGSGIMGLEAISRGFTEVYVFEKNKKAAEIIEKNYKELGLTPNLVIGDSLKLLNSFEKGFDVIYIDPPYESDLYANVLEIIYDKFSEKTIVIAEHSKSLPPNKYSVIKEKIYGGKFVTFLTKKRLQN